MVDSDLAVRELRRIVWLLLGLQLVVAGGLMPDWQPAVYVGFAISFLAIVLPEPVAAGAR